MEANTKYLIAIAILLMILMLAFLFTNTQMAGSMKGVNSGVASMVDNISQVAGDLRK